MRKLSGIAFLLLVVGCGPKTPSISIGSNTLSIVEQNFGKGDYFCPALANGEFMVVLSDSHLCDGLKVDGGAKNAFHGPTDEANLRIVFPSMLTVVPKINMFTVGTANDSCSMTAGNATSAVVVYSHNTGGQAKYDQQVYAISGNVEVDDYNAMSGTLTGKIDVMISGSQLQTDFNATACNGIVPGVGW
jgi:hypothetical protein